MGSRFWNHHPTWYVRWRRSGTGRWWKRRLSKARRRYAQLYLCEGIRYKEPSMIESTINYKLW